jgi:hypothetical protein
MERELGQEYRGVERERFLKDNCDQVVEKGYMKPFESGELQKFKDDLAEVSIALNDIDEEKKEVMSVFKEKSKPLNEEMKELLMNIKQKAVFVSENCFKFIDRDEKMVGFYNSEGLMIESRPANADELQLSIFTGVSKTGTNN